mmetsp:Transcript_19822/g.42887  ORF Transcript_19822/g.42887 Transcript_19822/m.42887 type:complete len:105 (+) Transcript_19822:45-359(+)
MRLCAEVSPPRQSHGGDMMVSLFSNLKAQYNKLVTGRFLFVRDWTAGARLGGGAIVGAVVLRCLHLGVDGGQMGLQRHQPPHHIVEHALLHMVERALVLRLAGS